MRRALRWVLDHPVLVVRLAAAAVALGRIAGAARRRPPLVAGADVAGPRLLDEPVTISVVVPARDEAERIGPLLAAVVGAPGVGEVIVVDDQSTDATVAVTEAAGATVVPGAPLPPGWAGKAWALQQGIERATGAWIVTLDADTRPSSELPLALVSRARSDGLRFVTVGGRFDCPTAGARWLHPAMLTTLVYRFGPAGRAGYVPPHRQLANGQCMAFERHGFLDTGGMEPVAAEVVEDVALARSLATRGWPVAMLDGPSLLTTRMYESLGETWRGWGRSIALPGVEPTWRQVLDLLVVVSAQALPLPRLLLGRGDPLDAALLLVRLGTLAGTAQAYEYPDAAYWLSPLADMPAAVALAGGIVRRRQRWRGRSYG
ncbi:MAG: glycosyltransferase [Ilumatobacteraceae bacterium]